MTTSEEQIGTYLGEPITKMDKKKLLEVIQFLAEENTILRKNLYETEDKYAEVIFSK